MDKLLTKRMAEREFNEIDAILPSLLNRLLLTDMECRLIAGCSKLPEKQGAVYKVIMSKTKEEAAILTETFRTSTVTFRADVMTKMPQKVYPERKQENNLPFEKPNPLLNNIVLACLFGFLPLNEIKYSRFVCRQWNSTAEVYLRKRATIHFRPDGLLPLTFMEMSKYCLPDLPFPAYKFSSVDCTWNIHNIENFFDKWGNQIKKLEFDQLKLKLISTKYDKEYSTQLKVYDVTPLIGKTPNLFSLTIKGTHNIEMTLLDISMDKLATMKTVYLEKCRILVNDNRVIFFPSSNVCLKDVDFKRPENIAVLKHVCYTDFFDFSQTKNLEISNSDHKDFKFDMNGQIISKNELTFSSVTLKNFATAKGDINVLWLNSCNFTKSNQFKIKGLTITNNSLVNLCVLPITLEKLTLEGNIEIVCRDSIRLPNLKLFSLDLKSRNSKMLTHFSNCSNLTELDLYSKPTERGISFHLRRIPRTVNKLRMMGGMDFQFANINYILKLDTLILEELNGFADCYKIINKIKPKVLVISYDGHYSFNTTDIIMVILAHKEINTVVVGAFGKNDGLHVEISFKGSNFSKYVDKESNYYKFENQFGTAIKRTEYEVFCAMAN